jgi:hypothetical protein
MRLGVMGKRAALAAGLAAAVLTGGRVLRAGEDSPENSVSGANCSYATHPDDFLAREARAVRAVQERLDWTRGKLGRQAGRAGLVAPGAIPRRNVVDEEIFQRLEKEKVLSAPLSGDEDFLRRVTFDLAGRAPALDEIRSFLASSDPEKRPQAIDRLLDSAGYVDKWTLWLGDLLQNYSRTSVQSYSNEDTGRNRMYAWIRSFVSANRSFRDLAFEAVAGAGNNFDVETAQVNWAVKAATPAGPVQDSYDMMMLKTSTAFLGMGHYDCILCHDGRGHLNAVSSWGRSALRLEAYRMAAFFSRMRFQRPFGRVEDQGTQYYNSTMVLDATAGTYDLNTTYGNRPRREALTVAGARLVNLTPVYRNGRTPAANQNWREAFARFMAEDPLFARNLANRLWRAMFNLALAEPVDALDPDRLDPATPAPPGWEHQATHPELLEKLAAELRNSDYNMKDFLRLLANSSAYQLSSRYEGEWKIDYVPLFARHYPRRLDGEEIHDQIVRATGNLPRYTVNGWTDPVSYAMQLPEPVEPRSNGTSLTFLNSFQRGNRDTAFRSQQGSIQMMLNLMNSTFVTDRVLARNSPVLTELAKIADNGKVVDEMFYLFLARGPSEYERNVAVKRLQGPFTSSYTRSVAIEDLAWVLINKMDFLFSY